MTPDWYTRLYRIDLKQIPKRLKKESLLKVIPESPFPLKLEVERFAYYFRRESRYRMVPFKACDDNFGDPFTAYLFPSPDSSVWAGACCFLRAYLPELEQSCYSLEWVWLHPYYRSRGILNSHWSTLRANHGDFWVTRPLSSAMKGFLLRNARDSAFYRLLEDDNPDYSDIKAKLRAQPNQQKPQPLDPATADILAKLLRPIPSKKDG